MAISSELTFMTGAALKQQFLEDVTLQAYDAGNEAPPIEKGGEWDLLGTGLANIASLLIANQQTLDADSDPSRATGDALEEYRLWLQLPEVTDSPAAGLLTVTVDGVGTIPTGLGFQAPNGFAGTITGGAVGVTGAVAVDAQMVTTGSDGNLPAGTQVRLVGGPPNLRVIATVPSDWVGGNEVESDTRKQERILSRLRSANAGWGALRQKALDATNAVGDAFVYWALGGPASAKVALVSNTTPTTREVPAATVLAVQAYLDDAYPAGTWNLVVQSALNNPTDVEIAVGLPTTGSHRWLAGGPTARTVVSWTSSETSFTVTSAATLGALSPGETIACWDPVALTVATAKVLTITGAVITTTVWSGGGGPNVSAGRVWIFAACDGLSDIVSAWLDIMKAMGPAENVASTDPRYQFARRLPLRSSAKPMQLTTVQLLKLQAVVAEATDITYFSTPGACPTPALAGDAPYVVTLHNFAIYPVAQ
jgi:uncharacterized phage protein gp47/JayE